VASPSHDNRRRARAIAAFPGVVLFAVVTVVLSAAHQPVLGLVVGAIAGVAVSTALLLGAATALLHALGARRADEDDVPGPYNLIDGLCASMGLNPPSIWLVEDETLDALSLGRGPRTAALVLTTGLVGSLDPVALEGVLAHELAHVKRCDIAPATVAAALLLPFGALGVGGGTVHRLAGRGREFRTDQAAVAVTRYPPGMREALSRMVSGPAPRARSSLSGRAAAEATRWLWTVALREPSSADYDPGSLRPEGPLVEAEPAVRTRGTSVGELDSADVRIAALDEL
jgi:Zn-dependent protease with chaperone function